MTAIEIGEGRRAGLFFRFMEWRRSRKERRRQPDVSAMLDGLNAHLLRDMGYHRDGAVGLRKRSSAEVWVGRTPPGWHDICAESRRERNAVGSTIDGIGAGRTDGDSP